MSDIITPQMLHEALADIDQYLAARDAGDHLANFKLTSLSCLFHAFKTGTSLDTYLRNRWKTFRDGPPKTYEEKTKAIIAAFREVGLLTADMAELWTLRLEKCPGHDDEGGRAWCAYCGDMPREPEE